MSINEHKSALGSVWSLLVSGRLAIASIETTEHSQRLVLRAGRRNRGLRSPSARLLLRVLLGEPQKVVAAEADCSLSSVAGTASRCLQAFGLECATREAPIALIVLAHAHATPGLPYFVDCDLQWQPDAIFLTVPKPQLPAGAGLSGSQRDVLALLLEGMSHREIATKRGTSVRTVDALVATAYSKLGNSGRLQVIGQLLHRRSDHPVAQTSHHFALQLTG